MAFNYLKVKSAKFTSGGLGLDLKNLALFISLVLTVINRPTVVLRTTMVRPAADCK